MSREICQTYWPWMPFDDGIAADRRSAMVSSLNEVSEFYSAGFIEEADAPLYRRYALALLRCAERMPLPAWEGTWLYPATPPWRGDVPEYAGRFWNWQASDKRRQPVCCYQYFIPLFFGFLGRAPLDEKVAACGSAPEQVEALTVFWERVWAKLTALAGGWAPGGWTHCTVNHERVMQEGFEGHRRRIERQLADPSLEESQRVLEESLLVVLDAAEVLRNRMIAQVDQTDLPDRLDVKLKLIEALNEVPLRPARSFYEAMLSLSFTFYFEDCDSPGRMDQYLLDFYRHDREAGLIDEEFAKELLGEFWTSMDRVGAWNVAIGGTRGPEGDSAVNELTYLILETVKHRRRPNLALRMPSGAEDRLWNAAFEVIATGNGMPPLYNNAAYLEALRNYGLGLSEKDVHDVCFGGCTETMIQGCSNVGSLAGLLHMLGNLERNLPGRLAGSASFEEFLDGWLVDLGEEIGGVCASISEDSEAKARFFPQMIRTLLVDDCIDRGREFCHGGARYNWEVVGLEGFANVIDSLFSLRELVFGGEVSAATMLAALEADFAGHEGLLARIGKLPKYGQGDAEVDRIAARVAEFTFGQFARYTGFRGTKFLASCLMFTTYADRGKICGATPDGRRAGQPLADSFGAYQGRDTKGPTALLNSVTSYPHQAAPGTLVINIRFTRDTLTEPSLCGKLRSLLETYFARGGMQIQINVVDQATIRDAIEHPERHENLIIRAGGFSAYFNELSEALKQTILERSVHA